MMCFLQLESRLLEEVAQLGRELGAAQRDAAVLREAHASAKRRVEETKNVLSLHHKQNKKGKCIYCTYTFYKGY